MPQNAGMQTVAELGNLTIYANPPGKLAVLTRDKRAETGKLLIVDKATRGITVTWPVDLYRGCQLTGPSEDMALVGDFAYFSACGTRRTAVDFESNTEGGFFDFNRMSLKDGVIDLFALPRVFSNPRIVVTGTTVYLFPDNRSTAWKLDEVNGRVVANDGNHREPAHSQGRRRGAPAGCRGRGNGHVVAHSDRSIVYVDADPARSIEVGERARARTLESREAGARPHPLGHSRHRGRRAAGTEEAEPAE